MRRSQAAVEFLVTYGWAFIIILTTIGALAYFGVLKVTPPSRCLVSPEFSCVDYSVKLENANPTDQPSVVILLANANDFRLNISRMSCIFPDNTISGRHWVWNLTDFRKTTGSDPPLNNTNGWEPGEKRYVECNGTAGGSGALVKGDKAKVRFAITYKNQDIDGFEHTSEGEVITSVS